MTAVLLLCLASARASDQDNPCPDGLVIGARTAGHCCPPDQSWGGWACVDDPRGAGPTIQDGTACAPGDVLTFDGRQCCNVAEGWYAPDRSSIHGHRLGCHPSRASVYGGLRDTDVVPVVRRHAASVTDCYRDHRVPSRVLVDRITVRFTIAEDGTVATARLSFDTTDNDAIASCLVGVFVAMEFRPVAGRPTTVSYPLAFTPW